MQGAYSQIDLKEGVSSDTPYHCLRVRNRATMSIPIIRDVEQARATILKRVPFDDVKVPAHVSERLKQVFGKPLTPVQAVRQIISDVRRFGDKAIIGYTRLLDGPLLTQFRVSEQEIEQAWNETPPSLRASLELAAERIRAFHLAQKERQVKSWVEQKNGSHLGQVMRPMSRVGVYAPGGSAAYPSSVLMAAVPARVAGVTEVILVTPPSRTGGLHPAILTAARVAQVDAVFKVGGAQAIAALAYGTATIPRVDKICGPGNLFVVLAKRQVYGQVGLDGLPGPTETLIIADHTAKPQWVAADLIAQAEHDPLASAILLTPSSEVALKTQAAVIKQLADLPRQDIAVQSLQRHGGIVLTHSLDQAVDLANEYAPEHLCLVVEDPLSLLNRVHNAGGIFLGEHSSEALGDYVVGPSHIMPTGGSARFASAVTVLDFIKVINIFRMSPQEVQTLSPTAAEIADAEGLTGHANAVRCRLRMEK